MRISDWSSDVCSSDLGVDRRQVAGVEHLFDERDRLVHFALHLGLLLFSIGFAVDIDHAIIVRMHNLCGRRFFRRGMGGRADRTSVAKGRSVSVRLDLGGRGIINKKTQYYNQTIYIL